MGMHWKIKYIVEFKFILVQLFTVIPADISPGYYGGRIMFLNCEALLFYVGK